MNDAIAFPQVHKFVEMDKEALKRTNRTISHIKRREASTVEDINAILPRIVEDVYAGGNIATCNKLLAALKGDRLATVMIFCREMVPYRTKDGQFTKKADKKTVDQKRENFVKFLQSGQTVFGWIKANVKVDRKPTDYAKKLERDVQQAIAKGGLTGEQVMSIITAALAATDDNTKKAA